MDRLVPKVTQADVLGDRYGTKGTDSRDQFTHVTMFSNEDRINMIIMIYLR